MSNSGERSAVVLVVDDHDQNRLLLREFLTILGHRFEEAENGVAALTKMRAAKPDLVLLDVMMPVMDGIETLKQMRADSELREIPTLMISGNDEIGTVADCLKLGAVDYVVKPFEPTLLRARLDATLDAKWARDAEKHYRKLVESHNVELQDRVHEQVRQVTKGQMATIFALSKLAESRDPETGEHLERMREYCKVIANGLRVSSEYAAEITPTYVHNLYSASPLHDIGKVGVPDRILQKPGKLTAEEFEVMKKHATIGADTLRHVYNEFPENEFVLMGIEIAQSHHEKWDGSGYPLRLSGKSIPLSGRILALGDVYDALTFKRVYKEAFSHEKSRGIILEGNGTHFDPAIVEAFVSNESAFREIREHHIDAEKTLLYAEPS